MLYNKGKEISSLTKGKGQIAQGKALWFIIRKKTNKLKEMLSYVNITWIQVRHKVREFYVKHKKQKRYNILIPHAWEKGKTRALQPFKRSEMQEEGMLLEIGEACKRNRK